MNILINNLISSHEEVKVELIGFEEIASGKYSEKTADRIEKHLQSLASANILKYGRLEIGCSIEILKCKN